MTDYRMDDFDDQYWPRRRPATQYPGQPEAISDMFTADRQRRYHETPYPDQGLEELRQIRAALDAILADAPKDTISQGRYIPPEEREYIRAPDPWWQRAPGAVADTLKEFIPGYNWYKGAQEAQYHPMGKMPEDRFVGGMMDLIPGAGLAVGAVKGAGKAARAVKTGATKARHFIDELPEVQALYKEILERIPTGGISPLEMGAQTPSLKEAMGNAALRSSGKPYRNAGKMKGTHKTNTEMYDDAGNMIWEEVPATGLSRVTEQINALPEKYAPQLSALYQSIAGPVSETANAAKGIGKGVMSLGKEAASSIWHGYDDPGRLDEVLRYLMGGAEKGVKLAKRAGIWEQELPGWFHIADKNWQQQYNKLPKDSWQRTASRLAERDVRPALEEFVDKHPLAAFLTPTVATGAAIGNYVSDKVRGPEWRKGDPGIEIIKQLLGGPLDVVNSWREVLR